MRLAELVDTSRRVAATSGRLEKVALLADCLRRARGDDLPRAVAFLAGRIPRIGVGPAGLGAALPERAAPEARLELADVATALARIAEPRGRGAGEARLRAAADLLARATREEQRFLVGLLAGEVRHGALEGVVLEALARATDVPAEAVRRAHMLEGDLGRVAEVARREGASGLARLAVRLFRPLRPMLASPAGDVSEVLDELGEAAFEFKLDGARVQVHRQDDVVRVFTRSLHEVTPAVPELVEGVRALPSRALILDGEVVAVRPDGRPQPFQVTMRRFGRKLDVETLRERLPLRPWFFDCLVADGESLLDQPARERSERLAALVPEARRVPRLVTADPAEAAAFLERSLAAGHEGVVAKSLAGVYAAGARGRAWLKLKPAHTLDLVVLAAEWGHGRRRGRLSNLHLGARDPAGAGYVMLGKTFKGLTDEMLAWQTRRLQELAVASDRTTVRVRPELVVEVAIGGVQASPRYPAGLALRLARVKRYRTDKRPEEADTLDVVRALHAGSDAPLRAG